MLPRMSFNSKEGLCSAHFMGLTHSVTVSQSHGDSSRVSYTELVCKELLWIAKFFLRSCMKYVPAWAGLFLLEMSPVVHRPSLVRRQIVENSSSYFDVIR